MRILSDFFRQEVPKSGGTTPAYYRRAMFISEAILAVYFLAGAILSIRAAGAWLWSPVVLLAGIVLLLVNIDRISARLNLLGCAAALGAWLAWFVYTFGWSAGNANLLIVVLPLVFFNIYEPPAGKIAYFLGVAILRVALFAWSRGHAPVCALGENTALIFQIVSSVATLLILAFVFILLSSSIQASERELTINNQALHKEAGTDPLTGLPNRRAMMDEIERYLRSDPNAQFSVAIADIDFFKRVNDTYGHNCGDYTLKQLAALFMVSAEEKYRVCRWGGEEFCFFLPGMNIDDARREMQDLCIAVRRQRLHYGDIEYSVTITIGVEENDYQSSMEEILHQADRKLYMGKVGGRDQVVV